MECACIKKIFDLSVSSLDPTKMIIRDQSIWMDDAGFDYGLTYNVHIKSLTSRGIDITIPLLVKEHNILTAKELYGGQEGTCIKDDMYCFSIGPDGPGACGVKMSINRAFLPSAYCALDTLRANSVDEKGDMIADEVWRLIGEVESQVRLNRGEEAKDTYVVLMDKLKALNCDCCK